MVTKAGTHGPHKHMQGNNKGSSGMLDKLAERARARAKQLVHKPSLAEEVLRRSGERLPGVFTCVAQPAALLCRDLVAALFVAAVCFVCLRSCHCA